MNDKGNRNVRIYMAFLACFILACSADTTSFGDLGTGGLGGDAGGSDVGGNPTGGTGGSGGTDVGGTGGSGAGDIGGSTGGSGAVGGSGGSTGGSGAVGGTGGSGAVGGAGGIGGGVGGSGGGPCLEYESSEVMQLCQGNCGEIPRKCNPNDWFNCLQDPSNICVGPHQWCEEEADKSGTCQGCTRTMSLGNICSMGEAKPFEWVCPGVFSNDIQDAGETDVDCGGPNNPTRCAVGQTCLDNGDCAKQVCNGTYTCSNTSEPEIGCDWYNSPGVFCCPESQNGCERKLIADGSCVNVLDRPNAVKCSNDQDLPAQECTQVSNLLWCCSDVEFL